MLARTEPCLRPSPTQVLDPPQRTAATAGRDTPKRSFASYSAIRLKRSSSSTERPRTFSESACCCAGTMRLSVPTPRTLIRTNVARLSGCLAASCLLSRPPTANSHRTSWLNGSAAARLSIGGTKNGAVAAEAVIVMRPEVGDDVLYLRKQQLQLASKMRFLSAQFLALLDGDLWLQSARHANAMASRLAESVRAIPGVEIKQPVESNAVFAALDPRHIERLQQEWTFYVWDASEHIVRWVTSFDTAEEDVDAFAAAIRALCG